MQTVTLKLGAETMIDIELFITTLFVFVDDFCQGDPPLPKPGPDCNFTESEAMTLLIFSQWSRFRSERDFYRFAYKELRGAFRSWRGLYISSLEISVEVSAAAGTTPRNSA